VEGRPGIAEVHRAHITSIPFENLDPQRGVPVSLAVDDLERKMVSKRRGGYCSEQNLLLKAALEALGYEVDMYLARVRFGADPGVVRPRTHLVLGVRAEGVSWHADVGFGACSLLEPLPFGPGVSREQLQEYPSGPIRTGVKLSGRLACQCLLRKQPTTREMPAMHLNVTNSRNSLLNRLGELSLCALFQAVGNTSIYDRISHFS
jgi:arylamine N-acetyltransferase